VVDELKQAIPTCPTFGPLHALAGQLEWRVLLIPAGRERIRRGMLLARTDPNVFMAAGEVDLDEGHPEKSLENFSRAVDLDPALMRSVIDAYFVEGSRTELAVEVAAGRPDRLLLVAGALRRGNIAIEGSQAWRALIDAAAQVKANGLQGGESAAQLYQLATLYWQVNDLPAAAEHLRLALELDYGRVEWRLERARVLAEAGRTDEALAEAKTCLRLRPTLEAARKLIGDLSVRVNASGGG
jgi:tetratricopeptide (TPR) repeat protein